MRLGLELTFVPDLEGDKEFTSIEVAHRVAARFNKRLHSVNCALLAYNVALIAKAERFRRTDDKQSFKSWIIEVNNGETCTHTYQWKDAKFVRLIQRAFGEARKLKLIPRIRRRGVHHPSGGNHIHIGISDIFADDHNYLKQLAQFERSLYCDYSNRPYVRWLFSEWFDKEENSRVIYTEGALSETACHTDEDTHNYGLSNNSISRRFSKDGKSPYSTYEFRFLDACNTAKDVALHVAFIEAWVKHHQLLVATGFKVNPVLTKPIFKKLRNIRHAWKVISTFLTELGLKPDNYRHFFEGNYIPRMRHGEMT